MTTMILLIAALSFTLTVSQYGTNVVLRYPEAPGVHWVEVCVESEGINPKNPGAEHWYKRSCYEPTYRTEMYNLVEGTIHVRAHLEISQDSVHSFLHTPVYQVRPEPTQ